MRAVSSGTGGTGCGRRSDMGDLWTRKPSNAMAPHKAADFANGVRECALRERYEADGPRVKLVHLAYQGASHELAAKTFDYSPSSIQDRWAAGERDMASGLAL